MDFEAGDPRRVSVEIISHWQHTGGKIDQIRDRFLGDDGLRDERDRAMVTEIVYGIARRRDELDGILDKLVDAGIGKMQHRLLAILRVGLYQILHLDRVPAHAAVNEAVSQAHELVGEGAGGLVNAVLRRAIAEAGMRPSDGFYLDGGPLRRWRVKWTDQWGEEKTNSMISFLSRIPSVGLRRNRLKCDSDDQWSKILGDEGVEGEKVAEWPGYLYVRGTRPSELPSFKDGITTVQDAAAGIAPLVLDPKPGENVLDLCCAPGGKSALIWELMGGDGRLVAIDKSMKRNRLTREGLARMGHDGIDVVAADAMKMEEGIFDRVLIDVPCSGTGVAHRRPDILINRSPLRINQLCKIQGSLLEKAAARVKLGGVLVYSTCSLEPEENGERVMAFEKRFGDQFEREQLPEEIPKKWRRDTGIAATWPPDDSVDGAFVVRWRRER